MHTVHSVPGRMMPSTLCAHTCICACTLHYALCTMRLDTMHYALYLHLAHALAYALCTMYYALCTALAPCTCTRHYALCTVLAPCTFCPQPTPDLCGVDGTEKRGSERGGGGRNVTKSFLCTIQERTKVGSQFIFHKRELL